MTAPLLTVQVRGAKEIRENLQRRIRRVESFRVPLDAIAQDFYETERKWFKSKGGGRWKPLSPSYAAWKRSAAPGKPIMQLSSRMWREFTGKTGHFRIQKQQLRIWIANDADYWKEHQTGRKKFGARIPRRRILATELRSNQQRWQRMVSYWLEDKLNLTPQKLLSMSGR